MPALHLEVFHDSRLPLNRGHGYVGSTVAIVAGRTGPYGVAPVPHATSPTPRLTSDVIQTLTVLGASIDHLGAADEDVVSTRITPGNPGERALAKRSAPTEVGVSPDLSRRRR